MWYLAIFSIFCTIVKACNARMILNFAARWNCHGTQVFPQYWANHRKMQNSELNSLILGQIWNWANFADILRISKSLQGLNELNFSNKVKCYRWQFFPRLSVNIFEDVESGEKFPLFWVKLWYLANIRDHFSQWADCRAEMIVNLATS